MYLNLYQKYMLGLLAEYGGLLKRQIEFMTKYFVENHLFNVNGYVAQMARFGEVIITEHNGEEAVTLPGREVEDDIVSAMDVMIEFAEVVSFHQRGNYPIAIQFYNEPENDDTQEYNIYPVTKGYEDTAARFSENYVTETNNIAAYKKPPIWIFLVTDKEQMELLQPDVEYSFAIIEDGKVEFYEHNK